MNSSKRISPLPRFLTCIGALTLVFSARAQEFKFNHYSAEKGLTQQYVYDINQNKSGYLWLATSEGLVTYDGDIFNVFNEKSGLAESFATSLFVADNDYLWIGHNQGGISVYHNGAGFKKIITSTSGMGPIVGFAETKDHRMVAAGQQGKIFIYKNGVEEIYDIAGENFLVHSLAIGDDDQLLIGTGEGLLYYPVKKNGIVNGTGEKIAGIPTEKIQAIVRSSHGKNRFLVATASGQIFRVKQNENKKFETEEISQNWSVTLTNIQDIFEDNDGNLWISTFEGVVKLEYDYNKHMHQYFTTYTQKNGLPGDQSRCVYQDRENNIWFGMYGSGLAMLKDEFFTFYRYQNEVYSNTTRSIFIDKNAKWFGMDNGLVRIDPSLKNKYVFYNKKNGLADDAVTCIKIFNETMLCGTSRNGLFYYDEKNDRWKKIEIGEDELSASIRDMEVSNGFLWVGTRGGLYQLDDQFSVIKLMNTENGLMHNSVNDLLVDKEGNLWVCTLGNTVTLIEGKSVRQIKVTGPSQAVDITCITQDLQGNIWVGTHGNGAFRQEKNKFVQMTSADGLHSDYCYFIIAGDAGGVWIGHRGGLTRIGSKDHRIRSFDEKYGLNNDFNELCAFKDPDGLLWFGSNNGTVKFDPRKYRKKNTPPVVNLKNAFFSDKKMGITRELELPYNNYRLTINFIGINFSNPDEVRYKYILKGFDLAWSSPSVSNQAYYPKISDGEYTFMVKACNSDGVFGEAATFKITVSSPFWKRWWFFVICAAILLAIVASIIKLRERSQKKIRLYLEKQLQLRTRELVEQKHLVEEKNKDITDSINYAHRIQRVILPGVNDLKKHIPDCFVFYKPRDIVSGDFYWYEANQHTITVAVADCTGHGVPGAFMSMIGTTIFKEISREVSQKNPALFISQVDERINNMMNPGRQIQFQDGMDMVLVQLDTITGKVVFSGAARPLLHLKADGTYELHKTCGDSIGGYNQVKKFTNSELVMQKGDALYLYTDGIVDQFGGPQGRKIMTTGFINTLIKTNRLTMQQQGDYLWHMFEDWRGQEVQIDDVLVIGLRFNG